LDAGLRCGATVVDVAGVAGAPALGQVLENALPADESVETLGEGGQA
jgi:hypothetical protein